MDDINLLEQIKEFYYKDKNAFHRATIKFKDKYFTVILKQTLKTYNDESIAKNYVNTSFNLFITAITQFDFPIENYTTSLNILASLPYYHQTLANEYIEYLNHEGTKYISTERELKGNVLYFFQMITANFFVRIHFNDRSKNLNEDELGLDWIYKSAFEIYLHLALGKNRGVSMAQIHQMVEESFYIFVLKYSMNVSLIKITQNKINELFNSGMKDIRPYKVIEHEKSAIQSVSVERFLEKIHKPDFTLKTMILNYLKTFFRNINFEKYKELNGSREKEKERESKYDNLDFEKEEVFEFLREGVDAIKHLKNGHAAQLLLSGRNSNFVLILKDAFGLQDSTPEDFEEKLLEHYENRKTINVQRNDCKIALIKWMKSQITDYDSKYYGKNGERIFAFLCINKPV